MINPIIQQVTENISERSLHSRRAYLEQIKQAQQQEPHRAKLHCGNLAHSFAASSSSEKHDLSGLKVPNIAIVSAYNDILSAHQPYHQYPAQLKLALKEAGCIGQVAAGVPAMCDGVTQGQLGMELSLLSRDVIAMSTAIGLSHAIFDGGLMLGICDKIVPGLLIAALRFGHLPFLFVPAGPMPSGISNLEKAKIRQAFAEGKLSKSKLLEGEAASYHAPGTCTFYGTANSNQLLVEIMGLQLPGSSFVNPHLPLRNALTQAAAHQIAHLTHLHDNYQPIGKLFDVKVLVNGMVGLLASGGSTNHTLHLVAIARAAGFCINWDDFSHLSAVIPLIAKIYPNGLADINHFQNAGGMAYFIYTLLQAGLLHEDVFTVMGFGLEKYTYTPAIKHNKVYWGPGPVQSSNPQVLTSVAAPFKPQGGLTVLSGNLGRSIIKTSALKNTETLKAKAFVFSNQAAFIEAFEAGELNQDCVVVLRFQGPKACGMPELHQLTPALSVLQERGYRVALVTDGRMSGASGGVPAAIHVTPEAINGGNLAKIHINDEVLLDIVQGKLELLVSDSELQKRKFAVKDSQLPYGVGRELFYSLRRHLNGAEEGACSLFGSEEGV